MIYKHVFSMQNKVHRKRTNLAPVTNEKTFKKSIDFFFCGKRSIEIGIIYSAPVAAQNKIKIDLHFSV